MASKALVGKNGAYVSIKLKRRRLRGRSGKKKDQENGLEAGLHRGERCLKGDPASERALVVKLHLLPIVTSGKRSRTTFWVKLPSRFQYASVGDCPKGISGGMVSLREASVRMPDQLIRYV